ncbi:MAG: N-acetylmuramoyl-L-alanine amidase [Actinobacteria bacterium]|nr:N-acetylmuramoyl-L-alanine amidase [Actinomycetota bacterium]
MVVIRPGDSGEQVRDVQGRLSALGYRIDDEAGAFGAATEAAVRAFQQARGLVVDGIVGVGTWTELVDAGYALGDRTLYLHLPYLQGDDVLVLQRRLDVLGFDPGRHDGIFGDRTDRALRDFQRNVGLPVDGIVGATSVQALDRLRTGVEGPGRAAVREGESVNRLETSLLGSLIGIDPGHGPDEPGGIGPSGLTEAEATFAIAADLARELTGRGAEPLLLRGPDLDPSIRERAARANAEGVEVVISLHCNTHTGPEAEGSSTYYFGREESASLSGQRLAELIQDELTSRMGLTDGRSHPKSFPMLRETRMPAVQVEPCFISNPKEEALLSEEGFRRDIAIAIAEALERYFGAARDRERRGVGA